MTTRKGRGSPAGRVTLTAMPDALDPPRPARLWGPHLRHVRHLPYLAAAGVVVTAQIRLAHEHRQPAIAAVALAFEAALAWIAWWLPRQRSIRGDELWPLPKLPAPCTTAVNWWYRQGRDPISRATHAPRNQEEGA